MMMMMLILQKGALNPLTNKQIVSSAAADTCNSKDNIISTDIWLKLSSRKNQNSADDYIDRLSI